MVIKKITCNLIIIIIITLFIIISAQAFICNIFKTHIGRTEYGPLEEERHQAYTEIMRDYNPQKITFNTKDGIKISGFLIERPEAKRVTLMCHGYHRSKEFMLAMIKLFPHDTLLLFDFRAHGESSGESISFGIHESQDVHAAVQFLKNYASTKNLPIYAIGVSMGSVALLKAASEGEDFVALVLDSPFASLKEQLIRGIIKKLYAGALVRPFFLWCFEYLTHSSVDSLNPRDLIGSIQTPVLIIHACQDPLIPVEDSRIVFNAARSYKELWIVESARHCKYFREFPEEYRQRVEQFFTNITKKQ